MLSEERYAIIVDRVLEKKAVTVAELMELLNTSESTIRRDLNTLHKMGKIHKVHGGATTVEDNYAQDQEIRIRENINIEEKEKIAQYAASLISKNDFVYIDAGTTTELMIDYISEKKVRFVTNSIGVAKKLAQKGFEVYILGGKFKISTEAIVGVEAVESLAQYYFTKSFFGTNGISEKTGFTTPDILEAKVKEKAIKRSTDAYILADKSKFNINSSVTFANLSDATIITNICADDKIKKYAEVIEVKEYDLHSDF